MKNPDVLIIGGGLAGLSAGWHLSHTRTVEVLESAPQIGTHASAQNAGMIRLLDEDPIDRALALRTEHFFANLPSTWGQPDPSRVTGAILSLAHDTHALHDAAAWVRAAHIPIEAIDRPEALAPVLAGTRARFHWYLPTARIADTATLMKGFAAGIRRRGSSIQTGIRVTRLLTDAERVIGVDTNVGKKFAADVVIAAGAWSGALGQSSPVPLHPVRRTVLFTEMDNRATAVHPWCWIHDIGCYVRPDSGRWLCSPCDERLDYTPDLSNSTGSPEPAAVALMVSKLEQWFPSIQGLAMESGWTGLRTFAPDRRPILGADPNHAGLWWAAGLGGFGVTTAYAVGETLCCWMSGNPTPWIDAAMTQADRAFPTKWVLFPDGDHNTCNLVSGRMPLF